MLDVTQAQLLRRLADVAIRIVPDKKEPFVVAPAEGKPRYITITHFGLSEALTVYRGDLIALENADLIRAYDRESSTSFVFDVTAAGLAQATNAAAPASEKAQPSRRWGKWVAVDTAPFKTSNMSVLWRVMDETAPTRTIRVLKSLKYAKGRGSAAFRRFVREIGTLATALKGHHSAIIDVIDYSVPADGDPGDAFYIMPLARGSFKDLARDLKGDLAPVLRRFLPVVDALAVAHSNGVIHRDIKPDNILILDGEPVLADFGICYLEEEDRLTRAEAHTVGTDDFVAPELLGGGRSDAVTAAVDVYSLAKTIFAVVSGGDVFPRENYDDPRFDLVARFGDLRLRHLRGLMERMVTQEPDKRPQTMGEVRSLLETAIANLADGVAFREGMYSQHAPAVARAIHVRRLLQDPVGTARSDAIRDEIAAAREQVRRIGVEYGKIGRSMPVGQVYEPGAEASASAAEDLMAVGLPLVVADEREFFERWLSETTEPLSRHDGYEYAAERLIAHPAAVLAANAAGALAWRRWRLPILRSVVDRHANDGSAWLHHTVLGDSAQALLPWMGKVLTGSDVLRSIDAALADEAGAALSMVNGLVLLKWLRDADQAALEEFLAKPSDYEFPIPFAPGLIDVKWVEQLLAIGLRGGAEERELARVVFDMDVKRFRDFCGKHTRALAVLSHQVLRRLHRVPYFSLGVDPPRWERWTGVAMPVW